MDSVNHGVQGFLLGYIPFYWNPKIGFAVGIIFGLVALVPDLYGEYMAHIKKDGYKWYESAHRGKINVIMKWFPSWGLHTWLDSISHTVNERWYVGIWWEYFLISRWREVMWLESLTWLLNITLFILFFIL